MYLALLVDKATHFYNLDCHEIAPLEKVIKYPEDDFRESTPLAILAFVHPSNTNLAFPKQNKYLEVTLRYLKTM